MGSENTEHDFRRGDKVLVFDEGQWNSGTVIDTFSQYGVIVYVPGYKTAVQASADTASIRHKEDLTRTAE